MCMLSGLKAQGMADAALTAGQLTAEHGIGPLKQRNKTTEKKDKQKL